MAKEQTVGDAGQSVGELKPGTRLLNGQYTIVRLIKAGKLALTYLARNSLDRDVVIKECLPGTISRRDDLAIIARSSEHQGDLAQIVKSFVEEAKSLSKLVHPNIVGVLQVFEENNTAYKVVDYVDGRDLAEIIEASRAMLTRNVVVNLTSKLLGAIAFVHEFGVLHRDIAPENILINSANEPILRNFGATRHWVAGASSKALSGLYVIRDGYAPQEFYVAGSVQNESSDLYSLGATLYHMITGDVPPDSQSRLVALAEESRDPYSALDGRIKGYPDGFLAAIDKAMKVLPKDRHRSAREWLEAIQPDPILKVVPLAPRGGDPAPRGSAPRSQWDFAMAEPEGDANSGMPAPVGVAPPSYKPTVAVPPLAEPPRPVAPPAAAAPPDTAAPQSPVVSEVSESSKTAVGSPAADAPDMLIDPAPELAAGRRKAAAINPIFLIAGAAAVVVAIAVILASMLLSGPADQAPVIAAAPSAAPSAAPAAATPAVTPAVSEPENPKPAVVAPEAAPVVATAIGGQTAPTATAATEPTVQTNAGADDAEVGARTAPGLSVLEVGADTVQPDAPAAAPVAPAAAIETDPKVAARQVRAATWQIDIPFIAVPVAVGSRNFPVIDSVDPDAHDADANEWIAPGVTIYSVNGNWVSDQPAIEAILSTSAALGESEHVFAAVRIKSDAASPFREVTLATSSSLRLELESGLALDVGFADGAWHTTVAEVAEAEDGGLEVGDILVSETAGGTVFDAPHSLETVLTGMARQKRPVLDLVVSRDGAVETAVMTLHRDD